MTSTRFAYLGGTDMATKKVPAFLKGKKEEKMEMMKAMPKKGGKKSGKGGKGGKC